MRELPTQPRLTLMKAFEEIQDPRQLAKCDHRLVDLLVIASCTLSSGGGSFNDMELFGRTREEWLRRFLELPGEPPGHDTFNRLFQALAAERFLGALVRCVESVRVRREGEVVALDGKVLRQAWRSGESVRQVVSVWATEAGLTLGHRQVGDKSNEITAVPELGQRQLLVATGDN